MSVLDFMLILRVMHGKTGVDVPAEDDGYVPPTLLLSGSRALRTRVDALANMVETVRTEIIADLQKVGFAVDKMRVDQFARVLKLQALNRAGPRLRHLLKAPAATPFQAYLELRDLLSDLAALVPGRDPWAVADYDHDN